MDKDKICISEFGSVCFFFIFLLFPLQPLAICLKQDLNLDNADYSALHSVFYFLTSQWAKSFSLFLLHAYSTCNGLQKVVKNNILKKPFSHLLLWGIDITNSLNLPFC